MNADLGFTPTVYGFGAGLFFVAYFIFDVPSTVMLAYVGTRRWIFRIVATWGVISMATAFVQGPMSFYALRFLLGAAEAGFYAGLMFYLTHWFPQRYRARYMAGFVTAVPLANVIGGPLSGSLLGMEGVLHLHGWQWLFLIEGLPACLCAFAVLKLLPDTPARADWLTSQEKETIAAQLAAEDVADHRDLWPALRDPRLLALCVALFGVGFARFSIALWMPQIVTAAGFSNLGAGFVVASANVIAIAAMILWARSSDKRGERVWHIAIPALAASLSLALAAALQGNVFMIAALMFAVVSIETINAPFFSLVSSFLKGTGAAGGIALTSATGQFGAFFGSSVMGLLREGTGGYAPGLVAFALGITLPAAIVLLVGRKIAPSVAIAGAQTNAT